MRPGRRVVLFGGLAGLAGCGFHPVYGTYGGGTVHPELASIFVEVMPERQGQLLRQALQRRLQGATSGVAKEYELIGGLNLSVEAIGIQADTSSDRVRINASSDWTLRRLDPKHTVVTSGHAHALDGYNVNNEQYFASDLEQSAAIRRCAETVADQVVLDLAVYFRTHPATA